MGLIAHTCVEATVRYAAELGYEVTMVKDATASYSDKEMHAALEVNIPNYATAIVTTNEVVDFDLFSQNLRNECVSTDSTISVRSAAECLAVYDIDAARHELLSHGVEVSEVFHDAGGRLGGGCQAGPEARGPGPDPHHMPRSAMPTATVGCCKRSRSGFLEGRHTNRSRVK